MCHDYDDDDDDIITHPVCGERSSVGHEDPNLVILSRASRLQQFLPQIHQRHLHTHTQTDRVIAASNLHPCLILTQSNIYAVPSCTSCYSCGVCDTECTGHMTVFQHRTTETGKRNKIGLKWSYSSFSSGKFFLWSGSPLHCSLYSCSIFYLNKYPHNIPV